MYLADDDWKNTAFAYAIGDLRRVRKMASFAVLWVVWVIFVPSAILYVILETPAYSNETM